MGAFDEIEAKWEARWREARAYEPEPEPGRPKFFATYPYSYMNSYAHVGHAYTMLRNDLAVRFERMRGKNALFPFAYHLTGTPIVAAANRVRESEESQLKILRDQGFPDEEIPKFANPWHWAEVFPREWRSDVSRLGLAIDWRRQFFTTETNPFYDRFIKWQFAKLRATGYVQKGRHPVIYCTKDGQPIADHDRKEGEGETPQEYVLVKLAIRGRVDGVPASAFLVAATLRPETMFAQTNVWVAPGLEYRVLEVGGETWIASEACASKLPHQFDGVREVGRVKGEALVGKKVHAPARGADVLVLPARFIKPEKGTGIVTSVPSDAPFDLVALEELKRDPETLKRHRLDAAAVNAIEPLPVIVTESLGAMAAPAVVERMRIHTQSETERLEAATVEVYKAGFYGGTMHEAAGAFAGVPVAEAKEAVTSWLVERGEAARYYEPTGRVVCRCLTEGIVKIVSDQWFMRYSDPVWKARTHDALERMTIKPEIARKQFHHVVDWLRDWACARESGLGTRLPWDEKWVIESLSDSTIYMAYYTIAHLMDASVAKPKHVVDPADVTDAFFDYVFLGKGDAASAAKGSMTRAIVEEARASFTYWYPLDFRNSGKDLLQNHLTFMVFNHAAIFPPELWPRAIGVNGWVMIDGEKMSKSAGNFITLRESLDTYGVSETRMALAAAGEGLEDASFERDFAATIGKRLRAWLSQFDSTHAPAGRTTRTSADAAFRSALHGLVSRIGAEMDRANFRTAMKLAFFDLQQEWAWYLRRCGANPNADVHREYLETSARLMAPFVPHLAEEAWERLGRGSEGRMIDAPYPQADLAARDEEAERAEAYLRSVLDDVRAILKVTGIQPKRIVLHVAEPWKRRAYDVALDEAAKGQVNVGALMRRAKEDSDLAPRMKELADLAKRLAKELGGLSGEALEERKAALDERSILDEAKAFLEQEIPATWAIVLAGEGPDPAGKARFALPRKPAIYVE